MRYLSRAQYAARTDARFWAKVQKTETCWLWTGGVSKGYGTFCVMDYPCGDRHVLRVHRHSWALEHGPIPDDMEIDHICHTPLCVRPSHLRLTTHKQNLEHRQGPNVQSKSGVRGVTWSNGKWVARVGHNYKHIHVGTFTDLAEAESAVIAKRIELHTHNILDRQA